MLNIKGGTKYHKQVALQTAEWCIDYLSLREVVSNFRLAKCKDCWGYCIEGNKEHSYNIRIATDQILRDFVATIIHEMVHVRQYVRNKWVGDGEEEAWSLQEQLVDEIWKEDVL